MLNARYLFLMYNTNTQWIAQYLHPQGFIYQTKCIIKSQKLEKQEFRKKHHSDCQFNISYAKKRKHKFCQLNYRSKTKADSRREKIYIKLSRQ